MLEVVTDGDLVTALSQKVSISSGKQGREGHAEVTFCGELADGCSTDGGPHEGVD